MGNPQKPHSHRRAPGGHFFGVKKGLFGGPILRGGKMAILGGFAPILGVASEKNGRFEKTAPKCGGDLGEFGENWGENGENQGGNGENG